MSSNSFGHLFRVTTWGESHGEAIGATIDGCPPNISLDETSIQPYLDKRKPGQNKYTTQRKEADNVKILSGVFQGKTTGTPIQLIIYNQDQKSKDYEKIASIYRPGHADFTYSAKYGIRDFRGGGRSSARETASRVAAGAVAIQVLKEYAPNLSIVGYITEVGIHKIDYRNFNLQEITRNPFWCPDAKASETWGGYIDKIRKEGNSVGATIEIVGKQPPVGIGAPIYKKLDSDLAAAMMSINAVKGVEIGKGMKTSSLTGTENSDEIILSETGEPLFLSNNAGGVLGGISTGQDIIVRFAVKPTSSILTPLKTLDENGNATEIVTKGRHDPCVGIRAVPVGEAMMACVILDHILLHRGQIG